MVVRDVNKRSNNFMAEQILKTLGAETGGRPGTWQKGIDAVAGFLERLGIARKDYKMTNGSGLYNSNLFSPAQLTTLLRVAYKDFRFAADFIGSLALAGADGTVGASHGGRPGRALRARQDGHARRRLVPGRLRGRAGTRAAGVRHLHERRARSVDAKARKAQDAIAEALVAYLLAK